jgi:hypothetical protein
LKSTVERHVFDRKAAVAEAHAGFAARGGGARRIAARAKLARVLWKRDGERRLASNAELDRALEASHPDDLEWIFELSPLGPVYFLPTRGFVQALRATIEKLGVSRVLEVGAGDGFLSQSLRRVAPHLELIATDSGAWIQPEARMNEAERKRYRDTVVPGLALGREVQPLSARAAIGRFSPELVLACWLPPGNLLDTLIRSQVQYVLEIGAPDGVTPGAWAWRFAHEFCEGPIEKRARCRLDRHPKRALHSRVTLYFGAAHPEFHEERVRPGSWLAQFKPV